MKIKNCLIYVFVVVALQTNFAQAKEFPITARVFAGMTMIEPEDLNTEMVAQSITEFEDITQFGIEATYSLMKALEVGFRYTKRYVHNDELVDNPATDYFGEINQDSILLLARVPFYKSKLLRVDAFAGVGGSNTTFEIKSATPQDGELSRKESGDWFATPYTSFGASVAVGFKKFFFVVEGGFETNKIDKFVRTGTVNANVNEIDLSGSYITVGVLFDTMGSKN